MRHETRDTRLGMVRSSARLPRSKCPAIFGFHASFPWIRGVKRTALWFLAVTSVLGSGATAGAQTWNDPRSLSLAQGATRRRAEQLADTGLADYQASAHGYVAFLAQLGEGLRIPP